MQNIIFYHDYLIVFVTIITVIFIYVCVLILTDKAIDLRLTHGNLLEIIWTVIPMLILLFLTFPSLHLLYQSDELMDPLLTIKVIGHQWYWRYQYGEYNKVFDSYIIINSVHKEHFRLLDVDNHLVLPIGCIIRILVRSVDVIHSFTVPSLGVKVDAVPGRLNQIRIFIQRPGLYFGQCSEICGVNHRFIPIALEATSVEYFLNWVKK